MLLITKILAVIIFLICLGFIAYWAIAIIKGDCVLKVMKSKRTPFHVESMDMKSVTLSCTLPIKNVGKQLGTIMDAFVRVACLLSSTMKPLSRRTSPISICRVPMTTGRPSS